MVRARARVRVRARARVKADWLGCGIKTRTVSGGIVARALEHGLDDFW